MSGIFIFTCTINPNDSNLMYKYVLHGSYGIQRRLGDSTLAWTWTGFSFDYFETEPLQGGPLLVISRVRSYNPFKWSKITESLGL